MGLLYVLGFFKWERREEGGIFSDCRGEVGGLVGGWVGGWVGLLLVREDEGRGGVGWLPISARNGHRGRRRKGGDSIISFCFVFSIVVFFLYLSF